MVNRVVSLAAQRSPGVIGPVEAMAMAPVPEESIAEIVDEVWLSLLGVSCAPAGR
jgi:hypothetical protein